METEATDARAQAEQRVVLTTPAGGSDAGLLLSQLWVDEGLARKVGSPDEDRELEQSLARYGVIEPIVVRRKDEPDYPGKVYEVVCGRRRFRAAQELGFVRVPAVVRELTDGQVRELVLVENLQRVDVHPLDESDGYVALYRDGYTAERIAAMVNKPARHVALRLNLWKLCSDGREALLEGLLSASVAQLVARIPEALQAEAVKGLMARSTSEHPLTEPQARGIIERDYMHRLSEAQFDAADAVLVEAAGSCVLCPKRTGNQELLFADFDKRDACTDPICYLSKQSAHAAKVVEQARAEGVQVVPPKDAKRVLGFNGPNFSTGLVELDRRPYWLEKTKKNLGQMLKGKGLRKLVVVHPETQRVYELVDEKEAKKALGVKGFGAGTAAGGLDEDSKEERKKQRERDKAHKLALTSALGEIAERATLMPGKHGVVHWRALALGLAREYADAASRVVARRGLLPAKVKEGQRPAGAALKAAILKMHTDELVGLIFELVATHDSDWVGYEDSGFREISRAFCVDLKKHEKQVKAQLAKSAKAKKGSSK